MNPIDWYRSRTHIPGHREYRSHSPWRKAEPPEQILIIRFHAVGDVALTLPSSLGLRRRYPNARIDLITSPETSPLTSAIRLFDSVHLLEARPDRHEEWSSVFSMGLRLRREGYQVILDLQRNWRSRLLRRIIRPESWGEFDRFGLFPACERTMRVFDDAGIHALVPDFGQQFHSSLLESAESALRSHGWRPGHRLVLLNPAGLWETRQWPLENYAALARSWPGGGAVRFLLVGTDRLKVASQFLAAQIGERLIDLAGRTSLDEAFAILNFVDVAVTEDSGLMHMAWSLGIPLVALFGSSRHYWSLPTGDRIHAFHSGDLPCGACMQAHCTYGDNRCLTRITPESVLQAAEALIRSRRGEYTGQ